MFFPQYSTGSFDFRKRLGACLYVCECVCSCISYELRLKDCTDKCDCFTCYFDACLHSCKLPLHLSEVLCVAFMGLLLVFSAAHGLHHILCATCNISTVITVF